MKKKSVVVGIGALILVALGHAELIPGLNSLYDEYQKSEVSDG